MLDWHLASEQLADYEHWRIAVQGVAKLAPGEGHVGLIDVPEPQPIPGHVVIEVKAAGVCGTDLHIYHDEYPVDPPVILGHELAGVVASVGDGVTTCQVGDRVTSETFFHICGVCIHCRDGYPNMCTERKSIGSGVNGAFARYVLVPERNVHLLPDSVDEIAGSMTEPLACCVHALDATPVMPGDVTVVSGPGAVGLLMGQVLKAAGADVTVLGTSQDESRLQMALDLGIDRAINVQTTNAREVIDELTGGAGADAVYECAGVGASAKSCLDLVKRRGAYAQVGLSGKPVEWNLDQLCYKELSVCGTFSHIPRVWPRSIRLMATGQVQTRPLASTVLPLTEWERAFEAFERKEGLKIVLTPS